MALPARKNRLSPPLMHVFRKSHQERDAKQRDVWREETGDGAARGPRGQQRAAITERTLRAEVSRDLDMLMNCIAMESTVDLTPFERVKTSILNYGFPDIAHRTIDELSSRDIDGELERVLMNYEPRLLRASVKVKRDMSVNPDDLKIRYVIHADLTCEPLNVPVQFVADVELDSGKIQISETSR